MYRLLSIVYLGMCKMARIYGNKCVCKNLIDKSSDFAYDITYMEYRKKTWNGKSSR